MLVLKSPGKINYSDYVYKTYLVAKYPIKQFYLTEWYRANREGLSIMLYIYGTVYNNKSRIIDCLNSLDKIKTPKKFLIIDNYSTDGTYEILKNVKDVKIKRVKCSRGKGRQLAMELSKDIADNNDPYLFLVLTLHISLNKLFLMICKQKDSYIL